ncbi:hypothetical protein GF312_15420 [Candidatus Poribacteria bacterium]|nr:hypothetical protein [Candidatus Poribacteria bacterium]
MNCKRSRKLIADYVNGFLEPKKIRKFKEHIAECEDCLQELRETEHILQLIEELKVEYPPEVIWKNFLPDLHKRIQKEAVIAFNKQQKQRLYLLPGWLASTAILVLTILASAMLWNNEDTAPMKIQRIYTSESKGTPPESVIIAGEISRILITESEAAEIEKLEDFTYTEPIFPFQHEEEYSTKISDKNQDKINTDNNEGYIEFMLENGFEDIGGSSITDSEYYD